MKIFFVQYNDPVYVQVEKIELMIMLATDENIDMVLEELMETTEKVFFLKTSALKNTPSDVPNIFPRSTFNLSEWLLER